MNRFLFGLAIVTLAAIAVAQPAQINYNIPETIAEQYSGINIAVVPQVELMAIIQTISQYPSAMPFLMAKDSSEYKNDVINHFAQFRNHPVVQMFDRLSLQPRMLNFSAPSNVMLFTDEFLNLRHDILLDDFVINRAGGLDSLQKMLTLIRDFAVRSSFNDFYKAHEEFYLKTVKDCGLSIGSTNYILKLESFYGTKQKSYNLVLVPLYGSVGFGNSLVSEDGGRELFCTIGPRKADGNNLIFGDTEYLKYMIWHEFSHPFVNPLTEKYWSEISSLSYKYDDIPENPRKTVCGDWQECINEFIIRAITTRLAMNESQDEGNKAYIKETKKGVTILDALLEAIYEYESSRDRYPTLESYYSKILDVFNMIGTGD